MKYAINIILHIIFVFIWPLILGYLAATNRIHIVVAALGAIAGVFLFMLIDITINGKYQEPKN